uniref:Uncharacterized protein n=1 Tax=Hemiselmis andersenii TaxID=464988 RepID=A0A7S1EAD3_HEMAN
MSSPLFSCVMRATLLFVALAGALILLSSSASAFSLSPASLPSISSQHSLPLRRCPAASSAVTPLRMSSSTDAADNRRGFLQLAGAAAVALVGTPAFAADATPVPGIVMSVLKVIGGGSADEFASFDAATDLTGVDADIYKAYKYASVKCPATEDPRASLRGLFQSKVGDGVYKWGTENGINPKVYDARGDGMTNQGKGGAIKGVSTLLSGYKKKGLLKDFTVDSSKHNEDLWLQGNPTSLTVTVTGASGVGASKAVKDLGLLESLAASGLQGYFKQVKLFANFDQTIEGDKETLEISLSWAGKARQKGTLDRRAADKLNAARAYQEKL